MASSIVTDHRTLRGLEISGFIVRNGGARSYERHWTGAKVGVCTVKPGPKLEYWYTPFKHRGTLYKIEYFDGCFKPFVIRVGEAKPSFV